MSTLAEPSPVEAVPKLGTAQRNTLLWSMLVTYLVLFATYAGVIAVLLPAQIEGIDPAHKAARLATVTSISSLVTLFAQPIVGAFSDRTRSRMGRRSPYIVIGAAAGAVLLLGLQGLTSILWITIFWVLCQVALNALQGPMSTIVSDRFEMQHRGTASAFLGIGTSIGAALGVILAGRLVTRIGVGYTIFGIGIIVVAVAFVLINRDYSTKQMVVEPMHWGRFAKSFWVSPRKHPDYGWAFAGRFVMILGYQAIQAYLLYILTDYLHMSSKDAGAFAGIVSAVTTVTTVITTIIAGKLSDKLSRRKMFVFVATIVMAAALFIPVLSATRGGMLAYAAVCGVGYGAYMAVDMAMMVDVLPSQGDAGKDLGVLNVATNIPQAMSPVIAAALLAAFHHNYAVIFIFAIIMVFASSFFVLPIKSVK